MSSELDFELLAPRLRRRQLFVLVILALVCLATAVSAWHSYASLTAARAEFFAAQERVKNSTVKPQQPPPPYYEDARAALELLQWPFDESLTEMESCLPDDAQLDSLRIDAVSRRTNASLKWSTNGSAASFDGLLKCLNAGRNAPVWRLSTLERSVGANVASSDVASESVASEWLVLSLERKSP